MAQRLSHSAVSRFQSCPQEYKYHYIDKIRPTTTSAALLFGTAIDAALGVYLKPDEDKTKSPLQIFSYLWRFQKIGKKEEYLPKSTKIVYSKSDLDIDLVTKDDWVKIQEEIGENPEQQINQSLINREAVGFDNLPESDKLKVNLVSWYCLYRKGLCMLKAMETEIMPNIKEVLGAQVKVELKNDQGDSIIGYADLVVKWKDLPEPVIFDLKTSSIVYETDSVITSPQLSIYLHALSPTYNNTRYAGFLVLSKRIRKNKTKICSICGHNGTGTRYKTCDSMTNVNERCNGEWTETINPTADVQVLIDKIPEQTENIVVENYDYINQSIKNGVFSRNLNNCNRGWGPCAYKDLCYKNKMDGLEKND